jgi:23S rRNA pseudouridine1911/1915/1917 synthase
VAQNSGYVYRSRVEPREAGRTLLEYHLARFPERGLERWRDALEEGRVRRNGRVARGEELVRPGDAIEFHRPPWDEPDVPLAFGVVFEDEHLLAVEKPSGLQVQPGGPFLEHTLHSQVRASAASRAASAPVHRLGRGTSGLVLFGKTRPARAALSLQFRQQRPRKTYLALVRGTALAGSCQARHPIGPIAHGPLTIWCARADGKPAHTRVRVLARDARHDRSLVAAQPITGRPDQIRIHLAALGAPLVGDELFAPGGGIASDVPPGRGGYFLHAAGLCVEHPLDGRALELRSSPPWLSSLDLCRGDKPRGVPGGLGAPGIAVPGRAQPS